MNGSKPYLYHMYIWGCPKLVLKRKADKLESWSKVCLFIIWLATGKDRLGFSNLDPIMIIKQDKNYVLNPILNGKLGLISQTWLGSQIVWDDISFLSYTTDFIVNDMSHAYDWHVIYIIYQNNLS